MYRSVLLLIVLAYLALATLYAVFTPKWQAPDEPAHFNYIRTIAETGRLHILQQGDYDHDYLEKIKAAKFPPTMPIDAIRYESYQPPLYYLAAVPVYLVARAGGIDAQVLALRLFSVALGVIVLLLAFAIVREIFPDDSLLALATVGAIATVPMHIAISASISNDTAAELVLALILLLAIKRVNNAVTDSRFVVLGGILFGATLLTKTTTYIPDALLLIVAEVVHQRNTQYAIRGAWGVVRVPSTLLMLFPLAVLLASPMFIRGMLTYGITDPLGIARHDAIVVGQPTTVEMIAKHGLKNILFDLFVVTFKSFWAQFGWMGVLVNDRIYVALFLLTSIALFGLALYALRVLRRRELLTAAQWTCIGLLAMMTIAAMADYILYNCKFLQLQGRYLFPALIPIALFGVLGLREIVAREYHRIVFALLYVALVALDAVCLFWFIVPQLRNS